ncbi:hypothetical protein [Bizionia paragorgiae]|jgi:ABC-type spermidine/putrescine transport system permease subunit I|uniref:Uncharacterized protein n=1 Tax=Bizionia paragorgiae TaxID=283786 RepID=A0A1H3ZDW1_BIZPA|nr:hypothetical protein [Bizionia paragorgiae]MDX1271339.1 hypothetical protein [Bizionia paragorgiae]SEA21718.1 hypothetical protein SAMN04487990_10898 [Bizionia paragorgiae]
MKSLMLPLVNWGMGAAIIGVFALVCVVLAAVVINMVKSDKKANTEASEMDKEDQTL